MLKVFESFAGIGSQRKALQRIGVEHEVVGISEIDKYAYQSYCAIHGKTKNYGDITKINTDELPDFDLFTYSFPCTDVSLAGKKKGFIDEDGKLTRSGLLYEALRIIKDKKPKYLLAENVKNLVSKKFIGDFDKLLNALENLGYKNYWKVLNSCDYGVPQSRERVFIISIRKDIIQDFKFPIAFENKLKLNDLLEEKVDEKYYIGTKRLSIINKNLGDVFRDYFLIASSQKNAYKGDGSICPSLTSAMGMGGGQTPMIKDANNRIRKITPLESIRIMNFDDEDYYKIKSVGISDSQIYKQCGNSIVVSCLEELFRNLLI